MGFPLSHFRGGPCVLLYRGYQFYAKDGVDLPIALEAFDVPVDAFGGSVDKRIQERGLTVQFTPAGEWEALHVLHPYQLMQPGELVHYIGRVSSISTGDDQLTIEDHRYVAGDAVEAEISAGGTLPTGLSAQTLYYVGIVDADTVSLHTTYDDAVAGTNLVDITATGSGELALVQQEPLVVISLTSRKQITLHNVHVTTPPNLTLSTIATIWGQTTFTAYLRSGRSWADSDSLYTLGTAASVSLADFDRTAIRTVPYTAAWGSTAPWNALTSREAIQIDVTIGLEALMTDADGIYSHQLTSVAARATFTPQNISKEQLLAQLNLQGSSGKVRGASLSGTDPLNITGPSNNPYIRLYAAALTEQTIRQATQSPEVSTLTLDACRSISAGVLNPMYFLGTAAPA